MVKKKKAEAEVDDLPSDNSCASGKCILYFFEARYDYHEPMKVGDLILDEKWRRVPLSISPIGVPSNVVNRFGDAARGLTSYEAAQALRWWFLAALEAESFCKSLCVETRIVDVEVTYEWKHEVVGVGDITRNSDGIKMMGGTKLRRGLDDG